MGRDRNEARVRAAFEAFNDRDLEAYVDLYADPVTQIDPNTGARAHFSRADNLEGNRSYLSIFPDLVCEIQTLVADDDVVMVRYLNRATHTGRTEGSVRIYGEPTGKQVAWSIVSEYHFDGEEVTDVVVVSATLSLLRQLGDVPLPPGQDAAD